jgi:3-methyladenine DNA glycosylase AlkC
MAAALKDQFGPVVPQTIAAMLAAVYAEFPRKAFLRDALAEYEPLSLTERARQISRALHAHLPKDYAQAIRLLIASTRVPHDHRAASGMGGFLFMPHTYFVADHGLDHFEESMQAQYELTQRFTAEFSIRAFLERHPQATLQRLATWSGDTNVHVRRLVSEGTRPRLPWASRLRDFQRDPTPVLALLERLKDDPELYVRRSVANNLNDIGKDHPDLLAEVARRWLLDASPERRWIVRHALRSAIKRAEPGALSALGYGDAPTLAIESVRISPKRLREGEHVVIAFELRNTGTHAQSVMADFIVHFVKANGTTSAKIFKLKALTLAAGERADLVKTLRLVPMTTRKHYPGRHRVQAQLNGRVFDLGTFVLVA